MRRAGLLLALLAAAALVPGAARPAAADGPGGDRRPHERTHGLVFVQTNELDGNRIVVYDRRPDGSLSETGRFPTGGLGGVAAPGTESDRLASQGSLVFDRRHRVLLAVNAGSNTVSMFRLRGSKLKLVDVVPSGGEFPASIAVHRKLVYVLNAGGTGVLQGFEIRGHGLRPLDGSARSLGLANTSPPDFLTSPGQVGFSPSGRQLLVTTKASGSTIDVFAVSRDGRLSATAVKNPSATPVPFAFTFDPSGRLVVGEAATSSLTTYALDRDGTLSGAQSLSDGQVALCWIERVRDVYYVANTGSDTLSAFRVDRSGRPSLVTPTGVVATTEAGPIDLAASSDGRHLYGQTGTAGTVDEYRIEEDGTLTKLGVVTGLPVGMEGIAAT